MNVEVSNKIENIEPINLKRKNPTKRLNMLAMKNDFTSPKKMSAPAIDLKKSSFSLF